MLVSGVQHSVL